MDEWVLVIIIVLLVTIAAGLHQISNQLRVIYRLLYLQHFGESDLASDTTNPHILGMDRRTDLMFGIATILLGLYGLYHVIIWLMG